MKKWVNFFNTIWLGLSTHKLRSFLTILGVVIGVASVITLMSIGEGTQARILSNIEDMGTDLVTIRPGARTFGGVRTAASNTLTMEDAEAITGIANVSAVAPTYGSNLQVVVGSENMNTSVTGATPEYWQVQNYEIDTGNFFSVQDYQRSANRTTHAYGGDPYRNRHRRYRK
jgi:ABC-type antimicrobial peptide transport system permease subunit